MSDVIESTPLRKWASPPMSERENELSSAPPDVDTQRMNLAIQRAEHQASMRARRMEYVEMAKYGGRNFMNKARRGKKGRKEP